MKYLILMAIAIIFASCKEKPSVKKYYNDATANGWAPSKIDTYIFLGESTVQSKIDISKHPRQDSIAIQTTVKVCNYNKRLFKVYTLAGHFYKGEGSYNGPQLSIEQMERIVAGDIDTIKFISSKPIPENKLYSVRKRQYIICEKAIKLAYFRANKYKILDSIAQRNSNNNDYPLTIDRAYWTKFGDY